MVRYAVLSFRPRLGQQLPILRAALEQLEPRAAGEMVTLPFGASTLTLAPDELLVESDALAGYAVAQAGGVQVALDTTINADLRREGLARDLVRAVQAARKNAGLALADRIALQLDRAGDLVQVVAEWGDYIQSETLAGTLALSAPNADAYGVLSFCRFVCLRGFAICASSGGRSH